MDTPEELQAIKECQAGNLSAFAQLYDLHIRRIYDFIFYRTRHRELAEDLTSQTFIKAMDKIKQYQGESGSFQSWLYRIARNTVIDHYRVKKDTVDIAEEWHLASGEDIEHMADIRAQIAKVETFLKTLSGEEQDIMAMRLWQDMSYKDIAAALGKTEASCKMMFWRSLKKVRAELLALLLLFPSLIRYTL